MRPYQYIRKAERGHDPQWCCEWCDGPYKKWAKKHHRHNKRADRNVVKSEIRKTLKDET